MYNIFFLLQSFMFVNTITIYIYKCVSDIVIAKIIVDFRLLINILTLQTQHKIYLLLNDVVKDQIITLIVKLTSLFYYLRTDKFTNLITNLHTLKICYICSYHLCACEIYIYICMYIHHTYACMYLLTRSIHNLRIITYEIEFCPVIVVEFIT